MIDMMFSESPNLAEGGVGGLAGKYMTITKKTATAIPAWQYRMEDTWRMSGCLRMTVIETWLCTAITSSGSLAEQFAASMSGSSSRHIFDVPLADLDDPREDECWRQQSGHLCGDHQSGGGGALGGGEPPGGGDHLGPGASRVGLMNSRKGFKNHLSKRRFVRKQISKLNILNNE